jgi:threonine dehydratase
MRTLTVPAPLALEKTVKRILNADVYEAAVETPLDRAPLLSTRLSNNVYIKREDLQQVFSFKIRGAYNKMSSLTQAQRDVGVLCASAGNHAQGLAQAAKLMGVKATIVMPVTTPEIKIASVRSRGAKVVLFGDTFNDALTHALKLEKERGLHFIHPFDDPEIIAGQGTVAMEIVHQHSAKIDAIFVPVGGGGLIAGIAAYMKYVRPETRIVGVEYEESACLAAAMRAGRRVKLAQVGIFADGIAVAQVGEHTWPIIKDTVDEVITVSSDEICAAVKDIFDDTRVIAEPAGAVGIAGMKKYVALHQCRQQTLVTISTGANANFDRLRYVTERAEVGEQREAILAVTIPERQGAFRQFVRVLGKRLITEFNYRRDDAEQARIFLGLKIVDAAERQRIVEHLQASGYGVLDLTDNELAKTHIRHMVGGKAESTGSERLTRFEFPERPGALADFLTLLGARWNITLFHYRNHGAAYGRVLAGMQVPKSETKAFRESLAQLSYRYWDETDNAAYSLFLS